LEYSDKRAIETYYKKFEIEIITDKLWIERKEYSSIQTFAAHIVLNTDEVHRIRFCNKLLKRLSLTSCKDIKEPVLMLCLYQILRAVRFKSVKSGVGIPYPEYAVVIPGALKHYYLKSLIFRGFWYNCNLLSLIERTPCI